VDYYLANNPDLVQGHGWDRRAALQHFISNGQYEGRRSSPSFDQVYYLAHNPDLSALYGATNYAAALAHWTLWGYWEGRQATP